MTNLMIMIVIALSALFIFLVYEILLPYHEKIFIFFTRKGKKELKFLTGFVENLGPSISAVSIVAIFIPIKGITYGILIWVFILGIMLSRAASFIDSYIKDKE